MSFMLEEDMVYMMLMAIPKVLEEDEWDTMASRFRYQMRLWGEQVTPVTLALFLGAIPKDKGGAWGELRKSLEARLAKLMGEKKEGMRGEEAGDGDGDGGSEAGGEPGGDHSQRESDGKCGGAGEEGVPAGGGRVH